MSVVMDHMVALRHVQTGFTCGCNNGYVQDGTTCNDMYKLLVLFW